MCNSQKLIAVQNVWTRAAPHQVMKMSAPVECRICVDLERRNSVLPRWTTTFTQTVHRDCGLGERWLDVDYRFSMKTPHLPERCPRATVMCECVTGLYWVFKIPYWTSPQWRQGRQRQQRRQSSISRSVTHSKAGSTRSPVIRATTTTHSIKHRSEWHVRVIQFVSSSVSYM